MEFCQKFRVFQIVSCQLNYIYNGPQTHRGVWLDHLEPFRILKKFRGILSKIPCLPENLVTGKISLRIRYESYTGIFRPFGTISEHFEKSSAEGSVIPCFPESESVLMFCCYVIVCNSLWIARVLDYYWELECSNQDVKMFKQQWEWWEK